MLLNLRMVEEYDEDTMGIKSLREEKIRDEITRSTPVLLVALVGAATHERTRKQRLRASSLLESVCKSTLLVVVINSIDFDGELRRKIDECTWIGQGNVCGHDRPM